VSAAVAALSLSPVLAVVLGITSFAEGGGVVGGLWHDVRNPAANSVTKENEQRRIM
jgi:hypothetical protein